MQLAHDLGELSRGEALRAVEKGAGRVVVYFDAQPSAPAAMAANDMRPTIRFGTVAWPGSTMTGRCESRLTASTAERSKVLRV